MNESPSQNHRQESPVNEATRQRPLMYGLSTCGWCRKARIWLEERFGEDGFDLIYVDLLDSKEKASVMEKLRQLAPRVAFPIVLADDECIVGYKADEYRRVLGE